MFIQNVSLVDIKQGNHKKVGSNSLLIQIVDPDTEFPIPSTQFTEVRKYKFWDSEEGSDTENKISDSQAEDIVNALIRARERGMDVIVHCHAGRCRSGAVAEVGVIMGFEDTKSIRQPNMMVKKKLLSELGLTYDSAKPPYVQPEEVVPAERPSQGKNYRNRKKNLMKM